MTSAAIVADRQPGALAAQVQPRPVWGRVRRGCQGQRREIARYPCLPALPLVAADIENARGQGVPRAIVRRRELADVGPGQRLAGLSPRRAAVDAEPQPLPRCPGQQGPLYRERQEEARARLALCPGHAPGAAAVVAAPHARCFAAGIQPAPVRACLQGIDRLPGQAGHGLPAPPGVDGAVAAQGCAYPGHAGVVGVHGQGQRRQRLDTGARRLPPFTTIVGAVQPARLVGCQVDPAALVGRHGHDGDPHLGRDALARRLPDRCCRWPVPAQGAGVIVGAVGFLEHGAGAVAGAVAGGHLPHPHLPEAVDDVLYPPPAGRAQVKAAYHQGHLAPAHLPGAGHHLVDAGMGAAGDHHQPIAGAGHQGLLHRVLAHLARAPQAGQDLEGAVHLDDGGRGGAHLGFEALGECLGQIDGDRRIGGQQAGQAAGVIAVVVGQDDDVDVAGIEAQGGQVVQQHHSVGPGVKEHRTAAVGQPGGKAPTGLQGRPGRSRRVGVALAGKGGIVVENDGQAHGFSLAVCCPRQGRRLGLRRKGGGRRRAWQPG
ncbi:MAG: hypothetical protein P8129_17430 [Anaerolineae bacterium]